MLKRKEDKKLAFLIKKKSSSKILKESVVNRGVKASEQYGFRKFYFIIRKLIIFNIYCTLFEVFLI